MTASAATPVETLQKFVDCFTTGDLAGACAFFTAGDVVDNHAGDLRVPQERTSVAPSRRRTVHGARRLDRAWRYLLQGHPGRKRVGSQRLTRLAKLNGDR